MASEIASAQDTSVVTNLSKQGDGSHLAPDLQRGQVPEKPDGAQAALPKVEMSTSDAKAVSEMRDPCNFLVEFAKQFNRIDGNRDKVLTSEELQFFRSRPNLSARQTELGSVINNHWKDFVQMGGAYNGVSTSAVKHMAKVTYPNIEEFNPSFVGTVGRSTASGAAGGGFASALSGEKFSDGAKDGAAIGAVVGALAYAAQKGSYNRLVEERKNVASWNYFELGKCTIPADANQSASVKLIAGVESPNASSTSLLRLPRTDAELQRLSPLVKNFSQDTFNRIDFDNDYYLSKSEIAEGLNNAYIPKVERGLAEIFYRNHDSLSVGGKGINQATLGELVQAVDRNVIMANQKSDNKVQSICAALLGAIPGFLVGSFIAHSPKGGLPGIAVGAVIGLGIGYFASRPSEASVDKRQQSLRESSLANTLKELRSMKYDSAVMSAR